MNLSPAQVQLFWREWATTCQALKWTRAAGMTAPQIDAKRKDLLAVCGFASLTKVDRTAGFTKVLNELIVLRGTSLKAARETIDPSLNEGRIILNQLLTEIIPCLELYCEVRAYAAEVFFHQDLELRTLDLSHMSHAQLVRCRHTFAARLNAKRRDAGETIHEMKLKSKVPCDCAQCCSGAVPCGSAANPERMPF